MSYLKIPPERIEAWVYNHFPDCRPRKDGAELRINNPFNADAGYHFNISTVKGQCHDWRGDEWVGYRASGKRNYCTFVKFVQLYLTQRRGRCTFPQALEDVLGSSSSARVFLRHLRTEKEEKAKEEAILELPVDTEPLLGGKNNKMQQSLVHWLNTRGITQRHIRKYDMMYCGLDVVWPYYEFDELVYWQSRSSVNKHFQFPPESVGVGKSDFLFGFDLAEPASYLIIVESIMCCQTLEDQCVATGGTGIGSTQAKKISLLDPQEGIILAPDNDGPGLKSMLRDASTLKSLGKKVYVSIPPRIEFRSGVKAAHTKDWNDIARYTKKNPRSILEDNIQLLTMQLKMKLLRNIGLDKRLPRNQYG